MTMIEEGDGTIKWECSEMHTRSLKDKSKFEQQACEADARKCGAEITQFYSLFDENGDYT
ncbi:hypothetical protein [Melaminivora sp.]